MSLSLALELRLEYIILAKVALNIFFINNDSRDHLTLHL